MNVHSPTFNSYVPGSRFKKMVDDLSYMVWHSLHNKNDASLLVLNAQLGTRSAKYLIDAIILSFGNVAELDLVQAELEHHAEVALRRAALLAVHGRCFRLAMALRGPA